MHTWFLTLADVRPLLLVFLKFIVHSWFNTGTLEPLDRLNQLTNLSLANCENLTGNLGPLSGLTQLTQLDLSHCHQLTGA